MAFKKEVIGDCELYLGDCREVLPTLGKVDAVVTDPPYGIALGWTERRRVINRKSGLSWGAKSQQHKSEWADISGDQQPFDPKPWLGYEQAIIWGANNYSDLPAARCWLVWDKRRETTLDRHGDAELAWTNIDSVIRVHRQVWRGIVREGEENVANSDKHHPTQKPVALMRWCVAMTSGTVLDPFMGSGTTGVACARMRRKFVGVEIDEGYFNVACLRIAAAYAQPDFFAKATPETTEQLSLGVEK
jgi:site-specific DNA-methyltransferase (adenine-specific)/modification methylase